MMKKLTCFTTSLSNGGAERQLSILANMLLGKGYEVEVVTFSNTKDDYFLSPNIRRVRIKQTGNTINRFLRIFRFFRNNKSDCIISFGARCNFLVLIPLYFRRDIKIIAGERCASFTNLTWYKKLNYRFLYKRADYIVPNSHAQKEEIAVSYPALINKTYVITNFTDLNRFIVQPEPHNDKIRIGIFGRYDKQKNYERLAEALRQVKEKIGSVFLVEWYGNRDIGSEKNQDYLVFSKLIQKLEIEDVVSLHGHSDKVAELIPQFDAMCLPSIGEGFSNSIGEYICCGKPVLCSDVADNGVMVKDGINGFLFDPTNTNEMADSFIRFFGLDEHAKYEMGKESRRIAEKLFDKEKFINSYIELIEK